MVGLVFSSSSLDTAICLQELHEILYDGERWSSWALVTMGRFWQSASMTVGQVSVFCLNSSGRGYLGGRISHVYDYVCCFAVAWQIGSYLVMCRFGGVHSDIDGRD